MKAKITLSFKTAQAPASPISSSSFILFPVSYSSLCVVLLNVLFFCLPKKPICPTLSNSHCYPKLLPDHSGPFLNATSHRKLARVAPEKQQSYWVLPFHLQFNHQEEWHISPGTVQGRGNISSLVDHGAYHTIPAHLIFAVRLSSGLYRGGF